MACGNCGENKVAMVQMAPGRDGKPWELCGSCWSDGATPIKLGMFARTAVIASGSEAPRRKKKAS